MSPTKIALAKGIRSGTGKGCATALPHSGWQVVSTNRRLEALHAPIAAAGKAGQRDVAMACDMPKVDFVGW